MLPKVFNSGAPGVVAIFENVFYNNGTELVIPSSYTLFAYFFYKDKRHICGSRTMSNSDSKGIMTTFLNYISPDIETTEPNGVPVNETIYFGVLADGVKYNVYPVDVYENLGEASKKIINEVIGVTALPFRVLHITGWHIGDKINDDIYPVPYESWYYSQCPRFLSDNNVRTVNAQVLAWNDVFIPRVGTVRKYYAKNLDRIQIVPVPYRYAKDMTLTSSRPIITEGLSYYATITQADINRGYIDVIQSLIPYENCPNANSAFTMSLRIYLNKVQRIPPDEVIQPVEPPQPVNLAVVKPISEFQGIQRVLGGCEFLSIAIGNDNKLYALNHSNMPLSISISNVNSTSTLIGFSVEAGKQREIIHRELTPQRAQGKSFMVIVMQNQVNYQYKLIFTWQ